MAAAGDLLRSRKNKREELWQQLVVLIRNKPWVAAMVDAELQDLLGKPHPNGVGSSSSSQPSQQSGADAVQSGGDHHAALAVLSALQRLQGKLQKRLQEEFAKQQQADAEFRTQETELLGKLQTAQVQAESARARERELLRTRQTMQTELQNSQHVGREHQAVKEELTKLQQSESAGDKSLQQTQGQRVELETEVARLKKEKHDLSFQFQQRQDRIRQLELQANQLMELSFLKKTFEEKKSELESKKKDTHTAAKTLPGGTGGAVGLRLELSHFSQPDEWCGQVRSMIAKTDEFLQKNRADLHRKQRELHTLEAEQKMAEDQNTRLHSQITSYEVEIDGSQKQLLGAAQLTGGTLVTSTTVAGPGAAAQQEALLQQLSKKIEDQLEDRFRKKAKVQEALELLKGGTKIFGLLRDKTTSEKNCCALCTRKFANEAEKTTALAQIDKMKGKADVSKAPENQKKYDEHVEAIAKLETLKGRIQALAELRGKISTTQTTSTQLFTKLHSVQEESRLQSEEIAKSETALKNLRLLAAQCDECARLLRELSVTERQMHDKESALVSVGGSSSAAVLLTPVMDSNGSFGSAGGAGGEQSAASALEAEREAMNGLLEKSKELERKLEQASAKLQMLVDEESRRRNRVVELQGKFGLLQEKLLRREETERQLGVVDREVAELQTNTKKQAENAVTGWERQRVSLKEKRREAEAGERREISEMDNFARDVAANVERLSHISKDIADLNTKIESSASLQEGLANAVRKSLSAKERLETLQEKSRTLQEELQEKNSKVYMLEKNIVFFRARSEVLRLEQKLQESEDLDDLARIMLPEKAKRRSGGGALLGGDAGPIEEQNVSIELKDLPPDVQVLFQNNVRVRKAAGAGGAPPNSAAPAVAATSNVDLSSLLGGGSSSPNQRRSASANSLLLALIDLQKQKLRGISEKQAALNEQRGQFSGSLKEVQLAKAEAERELGSSL